MDGRAVAIGLYVEPMARSRSRYRREASRRAAFAPHARQYAARPAIAVASPARREELCRILVERVVVRDRQLETIDWTPPARPFFKRQREYPQGALGTRPLSDEDASLAWYVA